ncbi:hypothetical protein TKK_0018728 [Trichogramma kaykai]|uniref:NADPH:adrenodoxin oxidoreductase, mitochondrial n=1 Tax=Trichogramma kaykai TaxID=54128 RepID=A0ABD2VXX1_9HYME
MSKSGVLLNSFRQFSSKNVTPKVCVVGAGPAGFYATQQILKVKPEAKVDILEKLPVPFGLVRFGVAPDHPEVKNVINTFDKIAKDDRVQFLGNVDVGKDVKIEELKNLYHAIVLTYGAEYDRTLNIPGENLNNVIAARNFVGWYNGIPCDKNLKIDLSGEDAVILGQGNVAIDIARILLSSVDRLKTTDITSHALEQLAESKVKRVWLIGRRGPLQAAFTIAELREMLKLPNCKTFWRPNDFTGIKDIVANLARPRKRLTELMLKSLDEAPHDKRNFDKEFHPIFLRGPTEFIGTSNIEKVKFSVNELEGEDLLKQTAKATDKFEDFPCNLAVRSIGYKSKLIDPNIPFDVKSGKIINSDGKVEKGLYAAGWVATGPMGIIISTMNNAFKVGQIVSIELDLSEDKGGYLDLKNLLNERGINVVDYHGWEKIDHEERKRGKSVGKPREKIVEISEMLKIALN